MSSTKKNTSTALPSSNWLSLQKTLQKAALETSKPRERRKLDHSVPTTSKLPSPVHSPSKILPPTEIPHEESEGNVEHGPNTLNLLRKMVAGELSYTESQRLPGKYLALDCEMVGVGPEGLESSLARVSLVNWYGAIQLDVFVRQRERVVDYRTQWSGIREKDMIKAKPFDEVQKLVSDLLKDRILIGHAVHNDLKALLFSHPWPLTRDTQYYAKKFELTKSKRIALRNLVKEQLGISIQEGEHSSVTDARATMAVYRLHKKEWEKGVKPTDPTHSTSTPVQSGKKRKRDKTSEGGQDNEGNQSKSKKSKKTGISTGLSTVIKRRGPDGSTISKTSLGVGAGKTKTTSTTVDGSKDWWSKLPTASAGSKGSIRLKTAAP